MIESLALLLFPFTCRLNQKMWPSVAYLLHLIQGLCSSPNIYTYIHAYIKKGKERLDVSAD